MLCTHNMPCVLVQLIDCCPWSCFREGWITSLAFQMSLKCIIKLYLTASSLAPPKGEIEKYTNGRWQRIPVEDRLKITKLDGQVWISLHNLLLKEDCQRKYDFNNFNKNQLLKVRCQ